VWGTIGPLFGGTRCYHLGIFAGIGFDVGFVVARSIAW